MVFKVNWVHVLAGVDTMGDGDDGPASSKSEPGRRRPRGGGFGSSRRPGSPSSSRGGNRRPVSSPIGLGGRGAARVRPRSAASDAERAAARFRVKRNFPEVLRSAPSSPSSAARGGRGGAQGGRVGAGGGGGGGCGAGGGGSYARGSRQPGRGEKTVGGCESCGEWNPAHGTHVGSFEADGCPCHGGARGYARSVPAGTDHRE